MDHWEAMKVDSIGRLFHAIPTRPEHVLSNAEFAFLCEQFWGLPLSVLDPLMQQGARTARGVAVCLCGEVVDPEGRHLQRCKRFFKGRRHDLLKQVCGDMVRDAFPPSVKVRQEPLLVEMGGVALDLGSRGDVELGSMMAIAICW